MNDMISNKSPFEGIKFTDENGLERWSARDLSALLGYDEWRNFENVLEKAKTACGNVGSDVNYHFVDFNKLIVAGKGANRELNDYALSRYACYLIIQNADPSKPLVAAGQTYFAVQTRRQELADRNPGLHEDEKRIILRKEMKFHNKRLASAAKKSGVETPLDYAIFQDYGYRGLYGGLGMKDIHTRKKLKKSQNILDHMGSTELAANMFRATQTEDKLRRENIKSKAAASQAHHEIGRGVRQTIKSFGGTMPENLPAPKESVKRLEKKKKRAQNKLK